MPVWQLNVSGIRSITPVILDRRSFLQFISSSALLAGVRPSRIMAAGNAPGPDFDIRGLELSGSGFWQWRVIDRTLDLMDRLGLNTLILGQDNLPNSIVWPRAYFSEDFMYARDPTHMTVSHTGRDYLRQVIRRAARKNIGVFLEAKEISYPYLIVELHPELMEKKGVVCPTHPFWWEFERARYQEVVETLPGIGGVVISTGSNESQVTFAARNCTCARCRTYAAADWHENLIRSIHEPLQAQGKRVVVRDCSSSRSEQASILEGCAKVSRDVVVSLKNTPQEFAPVFPDNPQIGRTKRNDTWVEFDAAGQFSGLGVFPVSLVDDFQRRLLHARDQGVKGAWFRADVEAVSDASLFNSVNLLNVFAGAMLTVRVATRPPEIFQRWLAHGIPDPLRTESEQGDPVTVSPDEAERFGNFLRASWLVMAKTVYVRGLIFADGTGALPDSLDAAIDNLLVLHAREEWEPGAASRIEPTEENLRFILAEKAEAESGVAALTGLLQPERLPIPAALQSSYATLLKLYALYVRGFSRATAACFLARRALATRAAADIAAARTAVAELRVHGADAGRQLGEMPPPHFVRRLLDPAPALRLAADLQEKMTELEWAQKNAANRA